MANEERFESVAAQVVALRIIVSAVIENFPERGVLGEAIQEHAKAVLSSLPTTTEDQKHFRDLAQEQLDYFAGLLWGQDQ
jgi:hypothetical protein